MSAPKLVVLCVQDKGKTVPAAIASDAMLNFRLAQGLVERGYYDLPITQKPEFRVPLSRSSVKDKIVSILRLRIIEESEDEIRVIVDSREILHEAIEAKLFCNYYSPEAKIIKSIYGSVKHSKSTRLAALIHSAMEKGDLIYTDDPAPIKKIERKPPAISHTERMRQVAKATPSKMYGVAFFEKLKRESENES